MSDLPPIVRWPRHGKTQQLIDSALEALDARCRICGKVPWILAHDRTAGTFFKHEFEPAVAYAIFDLVEEEVPCGSDDCSGTVI